MKRTMALLWIVALGGCSDDGSSAEGTGELPVATGPSDTTGAESTGETGMTEGPGSTGSEEESSSTGDETGEMPSAPQAHTVIYTAGPAWDPMLPPEEQDLAAHFEYIEGLFAAGQVLAYGPFLTDGRGFYVHLGETTPDIEASIAEDPGVISGVLALDEMGTWDLVVEGLDADIGDDALFVLEYRPGPQWEDGVSLLEQDINDHLDYVGGLFVAGDLLVGGPAGDEHGRYVIAATDDEAAATIVDGDPSVARGLFEVDVVPWAPFARQSVADALEK